MDTTGGQLYIYSVKICNILYHFKETCHLSSKLHNFSFKKIFKNFFLLFQKSLKLYYNKIHNLTRISSQKYQTIKSSFNSDFKVWQKNFLYSVAIQQKHQSSAANASIKTPSSLSISTGLPIWPFMPMARACCLSSSKALAVMAYIGIFFFASSGMLRINFAA